jgi:hypothetical protein
MHESQMAVKVVRRPRGWPAESDGMLLVRQGSGGQLRDIE